MQPLAQPSPCWSRTRSALTGVGCIGTLSVSLPQGLPSPTLGASISRPLLLSKPLFPSQMRADRRLIFLCVLDTRTLTTPSMTRSHKPRFSRMCSNGRALVGELADRRSATAIRIASLSGRLKAAEALAKGKACVFATGSFGRREAGPYSDLDPFIAGKSDGKPGGDGKEGSLKLLTKSVSRQISLDPRTEDPRVLWRRSLPHTLLRSRIYKDPRHARG